MTIQPITGQTPIEALSKAEVRRLAQDSDKAVDLILRLQAQCSTLRDELEISKKMFTASAANKRAEELQNQVDILKSENGILRPMANRKYREQCAVVLWGHSIEPYGYGIRCRTCEMLAYNKEVYEKGDPESVYPLKNYKGLDVDTPYTLVFPRPSLCQLYL